MMTNNISHRRDFMIEYGPEIHAARSRKRISQAELARRTGIYQATLVDIEQCRVGIDDITYRKLLDAINAEPNANSEAAA